VQVTPCSLTRWAQVYGKTVQTLSALRVLDKLGRAPLPALIVCPNSIKDQWAERTAEWLPEATPYVVRGSAKERRDVLAAAKEDPSALVIVNIEAMRILSRVAGYGSIRLQKCRECDPENGDERMNAARCEMHRKALNEFEFKTCVLDEAHRVKDPKAKQTRAIWYVFHQSNVQRRWALTGTPIANHPGELWSTMHAIDPSEFPVKSKFLDRYAMMSWNPFGGVDVVGLRLDTREELFKFFDPRFRRMTKSLVLSQLPPKTRIIHTVEMTPKQRRAYNEMEAGNVSYLDNGELLVARTNLAGRTRMLQLASSYCDVVKPDPDDFTTWTVEMRDPSPKVDALLELIDDLKVYDVDGPSIVVAAEQRKLLELAADRLTKEKLPHTMITGAVPDAQRSLNLARFQRGDVKLLMFTYKAGGVGLDMTQASVQIRLQRSWSLVDNKQGEDRVHRIGSEKHKSITIVDVVAAGTVEEVQMRRLAEKLQRLEEINRDRARLQAAGISTSSLDEEEELLMSADLGSPGGSV
jgi:SNF2 family DNA or RNA helicase